MYAPPPVIYTPPFGCGSYYAPYFGYGGGINFHYYGGGHRHHHSHYNHHGRGHRW